MLVSTEAIVLSYLKYSETSIIVKCFTQSDGLKSYLIKGVRSAKKKKINIGFFQPLTILEIDANHRNQGSLESIRSAKIIKPYKIDNLIEKIHEQIPEMVTIIGWSLGGQIAMKYCLKYPKTVNNLVCISSTPCFIRKLGWEYGISNNFFSILLS